MASDGNTLTGLWFDGQKGFPSDLSTDDEDRLLPVFAETDRWLTLYFSGRDPGFTPALRPEGTDFRRAVWDILLTVPYGRTTTYGEIAALVASKTGSVRVSARAVGGAVARNPVSLIIPCHRVIGADGSLTGYAGGTDRKLFLLRLEHADFLKGAP